MALLNRTLSQLGNENHCAINLAYGTQHTLRIVVQKDKYLETVFINNQDSYKTDLDIANAVREAIKRIDDQIEKAKEDEDYDSILEIFDSMKKKED